MDDDRIKELREHYDHEHPVCECLDEIDRLRDSQYHTNQQSIARDTRLSEALVEAKTLRAKLARAEVSLQAIAAPGHTFTREMLIDEAQLVLADIKKGARIMKNPNRLVVSEAAEYLGVSRSWLYAAIDGPVKTRIGGKVFYMLADLDDYLRNCREVKCPSTNNQHPQSGGVSSTSPGSVTASAQAKPIALRLREKSAAYEARLSKMPPSNAGE